MIWSAADPKGQRQCERMHLKDMEANILTCNLNAPKIRNVVNPFPTPVVIIATKYDTFRDNES